MKKSELKQDLKEIEKRKEVAKEANKFSTTISKTSQFFGYALVTIFLAYLFITHYLLLALSAYVFLLLELPETALVLGNVRQLYFALFLLMCLGIALISLPKLLMRAKQKNG